MTPSAATLLHLEAGPTARAVGNIPGLDGLRAISILIVMTSHSGLHHIVPGVFGVTVFFFISGFLITTLMLDEERRNGRVAIGRFYLRRALRLYPPLLLYVGTMCVVILARGDSIDPLGLAGALFYFANYLYALARVHLDAFGIHLWSLSVEEHFYLVFPLLFVLGIGRSVRALAAMVAAALAIRIGIVAWQAAAGAPNETYLIVATEARYDAILIGCLTAVAVRRPFGARFVEVATRPWVVAAALAALLLGFVLRDPLFRQTLRFTLQEIALVPLVLAAVYTPRYAPAKRLLNHPAARWIGVLSYSLYLWHDVIFDAVRGALPGLPAVAGYAAGWLCTFVLALAVYVAVEQPVARLRRRFGSGAHEVRDAPAPTTGTADAPATRPANGHGAAAADR